MNMQRILLTGTLLLMLGLFTVSCEKPTAPVFDNVFDPYGTTFKPYHPDIDAYQLDSLSIRGAVYSQDNYTVTIIVERRIGIDPTYTRILEVSPEMWSFIDRDNIKKGEVYYYRCMAVGPNGRTSTYSSTVAVLMQ